MNNMSKVKGRYFRPRDDGIKGTPYDSMLEKRLHEGPLSVAEHHQVKVPYVWEHKYEPDFKLGNILIECKGYFQDRADCTKYLWVRKSLTEEELVFIFEAPYKPIHFQPPKKDGTRMLHHEWADKHGFRWFSEDNIGDLLNEQEHPSDS